MSIPAPSESPAVPPANPIAGEIASNAELVALLLNGSPQIQKAFAAIVTILQLDLGGVDQAITDAELAAREDGLTETERQCQESRAVWIKAIAAVDDLRTSWPTLKACLYVADEFPQAIARTRSGYTIQCEEMIDRVAAIVYQLKKPGGDARIPYSLACSLMRLEETHAQIRKLTAYCAEPFCSSREVLEVVGSNWRCPMHRGGGA